MWTAVLDINNNGGQAYGGAFMMTKETQLRLKRASQKTKALIEREFYYRVAKDDPVPKAAPVAAPPAAAPTSSGGSCKFMKSVSFCTTKL